MLRAPVGSRSFATLRQVVLKKNAGSAFEAFNVASVKETPALGGENSVKLKLLGSVVTPRDVDVMRSGANAVGKPVGHAGLFEVVDASASAKLKKGDKVQAIGTVPAWQTELVAPEAAVSKVADGVTAQNFADYLGHAQAVSILKNKGLKKGDTIAVSEAQSPLGLGVVRVGKKLGLNVIAIVAPRAESDKALERIKDAGAHIVAGEAFTNKSYVVSHAFRRLISDLPPTRIVVDNVGSLVAHELARTLAPNGIMYVTGGAPFTLPSSLFVDRKIVVRGVEEPTVADYDEAASLLSGLGKTGSPVVEFNFDNVAKAVDGVGFGPVCLLKA